MTHLKIKHSIKVDLNCLDPGHVHLNNLNAPVLNVLLTLRMLSVLPAKTFSSLVCSERETYPSTCIWNKLMVHMYIVINTTIFLIVRLILLRYNYMFRPSMLAIFRLYMKHLTISYIYLRVESLQFVEWGECEISFCVFRRVVDRVCLGVLINELYFNNTP